MFTAWDNEAIHENCYFVVQTQKELDQHQGELQPPNFY